MSDRNGTKRRRKGRPEVDGLEGIEGGRLANAAVASESVERKTAWKLVPCAVHQPCGELVVQLAHANARSAMARTRSANGPCTAASGAAAPYAAA